MIKEMSFKCLLGASFRRIQKLNQKYMVEQFLQRYFIYDSLRFLSVNYFCKKETIFYMIKEMSFKCLLGASFRRIQKLNQKYMVEQFLQRYFIYDSLRFLSVNYFCKKAPSQMFEWVLNKLWAIISAAYLECSQKSEVECFCKNVNNF